MQIPPPDMPQFLLYGEVEEEPLKVKAGIQALVSAAAFKAETFHL